MPPPPPRKRLRAKQTMNYTFQLAAGAQPVMHHAHPASCIKSLLPLLLVLLTACGPKAVVPEQAKRVTAQAKIYPDYRDVTIPWNIAPLNFMAQEGASEYVCQLRAADGQELVVAAGSDGKLCFEPGQWRALLTSHKGQKLTATLYAKQGGEWTQHPDYHLTVAPDSIDHFLSYRLIEPSYELYRQLGLYQRDLTSFEEWPIYENNRTYEQDNNHCVNCHNFQGYDTQRWLFHVRADHGGTVLVEQGKVRRLDMRADSVLGNAVYPAWHPTRNWIVFSSNLTGQVFFMHDRKKIEVVDFGSDLTFFDADRGEISNVLRTDTQMETFPAWAPDGRTLYYCKAEMPVFAGRTVDERTNIIMSEYPNARYDLMSMSFDERTRSFGEPRVEVACSAHGQSASLPRVSPDGRYVLFVMGKYGQFHIWHPSSDLYVKDLQTGQVRPLRQANSNNVDSYHAWSSNGRWIVVASRRDDGSYSRPYFAYFDRQGHDHKAFLLPQEDPEYLLLQMKSYNVPELTRGRVHTTPEEIRRAVYDDEHVQSVKYK